MEENILHIFTHYGHTYTFRNVEILCDNEAVLEFRYSAMSDGNPKIATVIKKNIVAWSRTVQGK